MEEKRPFSVDLLVALLKHVLEGYLEWQQIHEIFAVKISSKEPGDGVL